MKFVSNLLFMLLLLASLALLLFLAALLAGYVPVQEAP